ncbi:MULTISPECIES: metallophosphoesterase [unclassified Leptolyngbya]|uniref:metallophosphoesterase family protein n=1 Tax=unclassified Leptolyngbya TaxID=2650499 RepID=UPI0016878B53|nr:MULTISPECIES: metallophosphoesterase [unclassified Leptolyngbya]MBD1912720.1 metallophosphoesterase [Leptolyngbya sp. FACHB-8]MBD2154657.1 metallophosphoesterase [Leptolyngbya sp. FACHB-16]
MPLNFRFAIISDPHIALPETIWNNAHRFHLVEVSIPAFESILEELASLELDFLLLPGDLTQHGEFQNHRWLVERLSQLPYPAYVVPGNHDVITAQGSDRQVTMAQFIELYRKFGYGDSEHPYYCQEIVPGVWLIGLNSIAFDDEGNQLHSGFLDTEQLDWLSETLTQLGDVPILLMLHHNVLEHLPGQSRHGMGQRYMLSNAKELLNRLHPADVPLIFTGHLHVQDIAQAPGMYEITTGSLVSYPHPYRVLQFHQDKQERYVQVESGRVRSLPGWENLPHQSREWMGDRSHHFMTRFLTEPPLSLSPAEAEEWVGELRYFWADISEGDAQFDFDHLPETIRKHLRRFSAVDAEGNTLLIDNHARLEW